MIAFIDYCMSFYGKDGLYPCDATRAEIAVATGIRLERHKHAEFDGDTIDREWVRGIIDELRDNKPN